MDTNEDARRYGRWLTDQLANRGMNKAEFARRMATSRAQVDRWVNGRRRPSPDSCREMAVILGVNPNEAMEAAGHLPPMNGARQEVADALRYLRDDRVADVLLYVRFLLSQDAANGSQPVPLRDAGGE